MITNTEVIFKLALKQIGREMSETCSPEVKLIHAEHVWRTRVQTLGIQDKKKEKPSTPLRTGPPEIL